MHVLEQGRLDERRPRPAPRRFVRARPPPALLLLLRAPDRAAHSAPRPGTLPNEKFEGTRDPEPAASSGMARTPIEPLLDLYNVLCDIPEGAGARIDDMGVEMGIDIDNVLVRAGVRGRH